MPQTLQPVGRRTVIDIKVSLLQKNLVQERIAVRVAHIHFCTAIHQQRRSPEMTIQYRYLKRREAKLIAGF